MRPSLVLRVYCAICFVIGMALCLPIVTLLHGRAILAQDAAILTLCWNVFFVMILPIVMDWSEHKYFKARFVQLEEIAQTNPELKAVLDEQCQKLSLPGLKVAAVDTSVGETFSYGLWRQNPRLVVPSSWLKSEQSEQVAKIIPSVETELNRFATRDVSLVFLAFSIVQFVVQQGVWNFVVH